MQMHIDFSVSSTDELERHRDRALALGARIVLDRAENEDEESLYVLADPSGHPFCLLVR
jgi:predicted lactoylglutathione lyase